MHEAETRKAMNEETARNDGESAPITDEEAKGVVGGANLDPPPPTPDNGEGPPSGGT